MLTSAMSLVTLATAVSAKAATMVSPTPAVIRPPLHHAAAPTPAPASSAFRQRRSVSHSSGENTRIEILVARHDVLLREAFARVGGGSVAHRPPLLGIGKNVHRRGRHRFDIADVAQGARHAVPDDFRKATGPCPDDRNPARQRLERTQAERLALRRQEEEIGPGQ